MRTELVSIIIPLYNSERYIGDCLSSCLAQSYDNFEIIVVDDGSIDGGLQRVQETALVDKRIRVIHTKNNGVSAARNRGIKESKGKYVCFLDADDCIHSRFVETMAKYMFEFKADFCFSMNTCDTLKKCDTDERIGVSGRLISSAMAESLLLSSKISVGCWNKMYTRESLLKNGFREDLFYGEGLYFICEKAHLSKRIVVCDDALYCYRKVNPSSATTVFSLEKMLNGEKSLLEIRKILRNDGNDVNNMWSQHYSLFCLNAMLGILRTGNGRSEYKQWKRKLSKYILLGVLAPGSLKTKVRLLIGGISPKFLLMIISRRKR